MKSYTGSSCLENAYNAGKEAANKTGAKDAKIAFVYASCEYDLKKLLKGVQEVLNCPVIGNTSFTGVIMPEGYIGGDKKFVGIMALGGNNLEVGVGFSARSSFKTARDAGAAAARKAIVDGKKPDAIYMTASPTEEEFFMKGIFDEVGRVPTFGGSCADNSIAGQWSLYADKNVTQEGVAVAFIYTNAKFANVFTGAYRETKDMGIITKIDGNRRLVEIDGQPAVKVYAKWRKMKPKFLKGGLLLSETITSPLGIKDRLGDLIAIRHPMNGNDDLSMNIGNNLAVGTTVIRMEASVDELIASVSETIAKLNAKLGTKPAFYHLVHCGGRRAGIADRIQEVYEGVIQSVQGVPFIMEFTFGEYGYEDDGRNTAGGLMLSFTAFTK